MTTRLFRMRSAAQRNSLQPRLGTCWNVHYGQQNMRRAIRGMEDRLSRGADFRSGRKILTAVQIAIELREVTTGDVYADAVTGQEDIGRSPHVDLEFVCSVRLKQLHLVVALAETGAQNA